MFLEPFPSLNHGLLLDNFDAIEKDYLWAIENQKFVDYQSMDEMLNNPKDTGHYWQAYPLIYNKKYWPGVNRSLDTLKLIKQLSIQPILATFSVIAPFSNIKNHTDHDEHCIAGRTDTTVVKYHLGIRSNDYCELVVNDKNKIVKNKEFLIFDESYEHFAFNNSDEVRGVLILSFLRSDLAPSSEPI